MPSKYPPVQYLSMASFSSRRDQPAPPQLASICRLAHDHLPAGLPKEGMGTVPLPYATSQSLATGLLLGSAKSFQILLAGKAQDHPTPCRRTMNATPHRCQVPLERFYLRSCAVRNATGWSTLLTIRGATRRILPAQILCVCHQWLVAFPPEQPIYWL